MLFCGAGRLFSETCMEISIISRGARSLRSLADKKKVMNVSDTACLKLDVIVLPPC